MIIPTTEIIHHINHHETPPIQQLVPYDNNNNNRPWDSDQTIHILVFLYEKKKFSFFKINRFIFFSSAIILFCTHIYLFAKLRQTDFLLEQLVLLLKI